MVFFVTRLHYSGYKVTIIRHQASSWLQYKGYRGYKSYDGYKGYDGCVIQWLQGLQWLCVGPFSGYKGCNDYSGYKGYNGCV
jgi:mRNA deadenylase 3'-5' endonuclease subunit Ccr4